LAFDATIFTLSFTRILKGRSGGCAVVEYMAQELLYYFTIALYFVFGWKHSTAIRVGMDLICLGDTDHIDGRPVVN